jgi:hypothetical protein
MLRISKGQMNQFRAAQPAGGRVAECCPGVSDRKVGLLLSFHPILFRRTQNPAEPADFVVLDPAEFDDCHLFPDGRSEAVIGLYLVKLTPAGAVAGDDITLAGTADHANEGSVVVELGDENAGELRYGQRRGQSLTIAIADFPSGETPRTRTGDRVLKFVTSNRVQETTLTARIIGNASYEYVATFAAPRRTTAARKRASLQVGSRRIARGMEGHDVLKYGWYLRRFGFLSYTERTVPPLRSESDWADIADLPLDGVFTPAAERCSRDFQIVSRGAYRSPTQAQVAVTFTTAVEPTAGAAQAAECVVWFDQRYRVEPHHGLIEILYEDQAPRIEETDRIVYGALARQNDNRGYVEVGNPVGASICHHGERQFRISTSIRTAIRLCRRGTLIFRLHNADPGRVLAVGELNRTERDRVTELIRNGRAQQVADYGRGNRDLYAHSGFRSVEEQDGIYAQGRTAPGNRVTNARGGQSWHNYGMAVDVVFHTANGQPSWDEGMDWNALGALGTAQGLHWGGNWRNPDRPHFQLVADGSPNAQDLTAYRTGRGNIAAGLRAVWARRGV